MRYLRLYLYFLQFSFSKAMEFRLDFSFRIIMDLIYHIFTLLFFKILFLHTDNIGGWSEDQVMVFVASFILSDGVYMSFFSTNCWWFPIYINRGDLDYYLLKPISPLFFLSLREFAANSFINLIFGIGIFTWSLNNLHYRLDFFHTFFYIIFILNGVVVSYIFHMLFYLPVFWTQSPRGFENLFYGIYNMVKYPDKIQRSAFRLIFTFLLPMNLIVSLPARYFFDDNRWETVGIITGVSALLWWAYLKVWKLALQNYSSASS